MSVATKPTITRVPLPETDQATLDRDIAKLGEHKQTWAQLPIKQKITYLKRLRQNTGAVAQRWVDAAVQAKGIPTDSPLVGEEWSSGPWATAYALTQLISTLQAVADGKSPIKPGAVHTRGTGQVVVDVFPQTIYDQLLLSGVTAQVWMQSGVTPENLKETIAPFYREQNPPGRVALVLGAGNIASIPPLDVIYKMYAEGEVCLLKMNPVNEYLGPFFEEVFAPLIKDGYVRVAYGGAGVGAYLCTHPGIEEIHITGSAKTYDTIVWGAGEAGVKNKQQNTPVNTKHITSELGNVSPTIVVPGPWTAADIRYQAENIATQKMHNGGFNCIASQVLVLPDSWKQTPALLDAVRTVLRAVPARAPYYPGAEQRYAATMAAHPDTELLDPVAAGTVPRILVPNVPYTQSDDVCFQTEAFGGMLAETRLPGDDALTFLQNAVKFSNDTLWGTLGANIIIHPKTIKALGPAFDALIADLRYGCVAINCWTGLGFLLAQATWGAYPGHTAADIQSGMDVVHNTFLFAKPEKSVVTAPFYPFPQGVAHGSFAILPKPPWFITNKQAEAVTRQIARFETNHNPLRLPGIFISALRG